MVTTLPRATSEQFLAPEEVDRARDFVDALTNDARVHVESGDHDKTMPPELARIMSRIMRILADGGTVTVGSLPDELTTTTAANLLGISRPTLMKMIHQGEIEAHKVGSHSRLRTDDVMAVRKAQQQRQREAVDSMRTLEDELGL